MEPVSNHEIESLKAGMQMQPKVITGYKARNKNPSVLAFLHQKRVKYFSKFLLPHVDPTKANESEKSSIVNSDRKAAQNSCAISVTRAQTVPEFPECATSEAGTACTQLYDNDAKAESHRAGSA
jgi:hypothetical protein